MQMKYLSLALAAALATTLTACGSDSKTNNNIDLTPVKPGTTTPGTGTTTPGTGTTTPGTDDQTEEDKKKQEEEAKKKKEEEEAKKKEEEAKKKGEETEVDPTGTQTSGAATNFDTAKVNSYVATQYIRGGASNFDYSANDVPTDNASSTPVSSVSLDIQNPDLTNIVYGDETITKYNTNPNPANQKPVTDPTTGEIVTYKVIRFAGYNPDVGGTANSSTNNSIQTQNSTNNIKVTNHYDEASPSKDSRDFSTVIGTMTDGNNGLDGLVILNNTSQSKGSGNLLGAYGSEGRNVKSTRVFGKNYRNLDNDQTNTYRVLKVNKVNGGEPTNAISDSNKAQVLRAITDDTLSDVQYGRVTANVNNLTDAEEKLIQNGVKATAGASDVLGTTQETGSSGSGYGFARAAFVSDRKTAPADIAASPQVDLYFYRGTNPTSIKQMDALPKDKVYNYAGHALMYGIDNSYGSASNGEVPNAFGNADANGIGNFVSADFNTSTKEVKGEIYNLWVLDTKTSMPGDPNSSAVTKDTLVTFEGKASGNTILGTSQYGKAQGSFKGSFYGSGAAEMGGSLNSVEKGYGQKGWGGVFGARRTANGGSSFILADGK